MRRRLLFILLALSAFAGGCSGDDGASRTAADDDGDFVLVYEQPAAEDAAVAELLENSEYLDVAVSDLNDAIALPIDIEILIGDDDGDGPFYDPDARAISLPYRFIGEVRSLFARSEPGQSADELDLAALAVAEFVLDHEVGHALIDVLDLPVTGREEDAADALATSIIIETYEGGQDIVLAAAEWFGLVAGGEEEARAFEDFAGEHSLDEQRFFNIICWVYGSDEGTFAFLVDDGTLPEDRAVVCEEEYERQVEAWQRLLEPNLK